MIILKLIEWLGQERKPDPHSTWDIDVVFLTIVGLVTFGIWMLDKVV
jgi:hypothetical protein